MAPRGLVFNEAKTRITHLDQGVDFLGFNIRRYRGKLLTKPSKDAQRRIRERLSAEVKRLRGGNSDGVIRTLNPIIAGWSAYYRIGVSSRAFQALDHYVWVLVYKWARLAHPNKLKRWVVHRHFGMFNPARQDRWIFGSRETGHYLRKFAWTKIVRHQLVAGTASPDDPSLIEYWAQRRRRIQPPVARATHRLLLLQDGRCVVCGGSLLDTGQEPQSPSEWEQWISMTRKALRKQQTSVSGKGGSNDRAAQHLIHTSCHRMVKDGKETGKLHSRRPQGLA